MFALLIIFHVLVCIALIIVVLLQSGKGAEIGASFGAGASQTVFGASGGKTFMGKMTTAIAVVFMLTSLALAYIYGRPGSSSVMPTSVPTAAPQSQKAAPPTPTAAPKPAVPAPSPTPKK